MRYFMNTNIKNNNITLITNNTEKDIKYSIMKAMHNINNETLLDFGLLFTFIWKDANPMERKQIIKIIKNNI